MFWYTVQDDTEMTTKNHRAVSNEKRKQFGDPEWAHHGASESTQFETDTIRLLLYCTSIANVSDLWSSTHILGWLAQSSRRM